MDNLLFKNMRISAVYFLFMLILIQLAEVSDSESINVSTTSGNMHHTSLNGEHRPRNETALFDPTPTDDACSIHALRSLHGEVISPLNDGTRPLVFHEHSSLVERLPGGLIRKTLRPTSRSSREELMQKLTHEADMLSRLRHSTALSLPQPCPRASGDMDHV